MKRIKHQSAKPATANQYVEPIRETPPTTMPSVEAISYLSEFWPEGVPMPERWIKGARLPFPCPKCRRLNIGFRYQAVIARTMQSGVVYCQCRACGHGFKREVDETVL